MNITEFVARRRRAKSEPALKSQPAFWTWFIENPRSSSPLRALQMHGDFDLGSLREHVQWRNGNYLELRA
jgi:hypothetical protein